MLEDKCIKHTWEPLSGKLTGVGKTEKQSSKLLGRRCWVNPIFKISPWRMQQVCSIVSRPERIWCDGEHRQKGGGVSLEDAVNRKGMGKPRGSRWQEWHWDSWDPLPSWWWKPHPSGFQGRIVFLHWGRNFRDGYVQVFWLCCLECFHLFFSSALSVGWFSSMIRNKHGYLTLSLLL